MENIIQPPSPTIHPPCTHHSPIGFKAVASPRLDQLSIEPREEVQSHLRFGVGTKRILLLLCWRLLGPRSTPNLGVQSLVPNPILLFAQLLQCALQPPAAIPLAGSIKTSRMLRCAQLCQCFLSQPAANPKSRRVAPNRPTFAQHQQCELFSGAPSVPVFDDSVVKSSSRCSLAHILATSSSKNCFEHLMFATFWRANRALATVLCTFCRQLCWIEPRTRRNRDPTFATPGATIIPQKHKVYCARECFHPWIHTLPNAYSSLLRPHANCSCSLCCWHDDHMMTSWWWSFAEMMTWWKDCPKTLDIRQ